jgi:hypothetical protein
MTETEDNDEKKETLTLNVYFLGFAFVIIAFPRLSSDWKLLIINSACSKGTVTKENLSNT